MKIIIILAAVLIAGAFLIRARVFNSRTPAAPSESTLESKIESSSAVSSSKPQTTESVTVSKTKPDETVSENSTSIETGLIKEQILNGAEGEIHYSYYLPDDYNENEKYPLMITMPGYDMMWFGEQSSGSNLSWSGFRVWTELPEKMITVSAQLTDWHEKSARQAVELTEYFRDNFSVNTSRIYAAGYSAGGETMSQAVAMRPDLYAAYLHGASQWDGEFDSIAENNVAVYIFMAENDEYYGSQKARDAYEGLYSAYQKTGLSDSEINKKLRVEIPDNEYFRERGITGNYHGGGNVLFNDENILNWITLQSK